MTVDEQLLLCDAQTSGGLLMAVSERDAGPLIRALDEAGCLEAAVVGRVVAAGTSQIRVTRAG